MVRWWCVLALLAAVLPPGPAAARKPPVAAKAAPPNAFADAVVVPWSLAPPMGATEARLGLRAERDDSDTPPGTEQIIVFGRRLAPTGSIETRRDAPGAEAWQSEAAQPMVPGMGDTCTYKSGCFDKGQTGLFTSVPALFGR